MKRKDVLLLLLSGFIVIIAWVGFSIYRSFITSTITEPVEQQVRFIPGNFDMASIEKLKSRKKTQVDFSSLKTQAASNAANIVPTEIPTPTQIPLGTTSAQIATNAATPATQGGILQ